MVKKEEITSEDYLKGIEENLKPEPYLDFENMENLSEGVLQLMAMGKKPLATELVTKEILKKQKIKTIRHDEKPECWIYFNGIYIPQGRTFVNEYCRQILGEAYTTNFSNQVIAKIEADTLIESDEFFKVTNIDEVCLINGIINIHTKKLRKHDPKDIFFNKIPVTYDPKKKCPKIIKFLGEVLKNEEEDLKVIQEIFGWVLYKKYSIQKGIMFCGSGRNGKGITIEIIKRFLGIDNCCNVPLQQLDTDMWALGDLFGKMANLSGDLSATALKETGAYKSVTGGDMLSASRKFLSRINFTNYAKQIFSSNETPVPYDNSPAFWHRWVILEFPYRFSSLKQINKLQKDEKENIKLADPEIIDKLVNKDEMSGLLNWALEGLKRLLKNRDFSDTKSVKEIEELWLRKSNSFNGFCLDVLEEDWESKIEKVDLKKAYSLYHRQNKIKGIGSMVSDKMIKSILEKRFGINDIRAMRDGNQAYCWEGIAFKSSQGSQDSQGFSTLCKFQDFPIGQNTLTKLTTLTKIKEEKVEK